VEKPEGKRQLGRCGRRWDDDYDNCKRISRCEVMGIILNGYQRNRISESGLDYSGSRQGQEKVDFLRA
jgi:hypothetical protein